MTIKNNEHTHKTETSWSAEFLDFTSQLGLISDPHVADTRCII